MSLSPRSYLCSSGDIESGNTRISPILLNEIRVEVRDMIESL